MTLKTKGMMRTVGENGRPLKTAYSTASPTELKLCLLAGMNMLGMVYKNSVSTYLASCSKNSSNTHLVGNRMWDETQQP
jgi:hypothetical protein